MYQLCDYGYIYIIISHINIMYIVSTRVRTHTHMRKCIAPCLGDGFEHVSFASLFLELTACQTRCCLIDHVLFGKDRSSLCRTLHVTMWMYGIMYIIGIIFYYSCKCIYYRYYIDSNCHLVSWYQWYLHLHGLTRPTTRRRLVLVLHELGSTTCGHGQFLGQFAAMIHQAAWILL